MSSESLHENAKQMRPETIDAHRAISSLMEELEAVDWYNQRVDAASDEELKEILAHNRDEEKEHAAMVLEWLRRRDPKLDEHMRTYLFTKKRLLDIEHEAEHGGDESGGRSDSKNGKSGGSKQGGNGCLNIGSLRGDDQSPVRVIGLGFKP